MTVQEKKAVMDLLRVEIASSKRAKWSKSEHKTAWKAINALNLDKAETMELLEIQVE